MSIQPNRVVARIIHQVDRSGWPRLDSTVVAAERENEWLRVVRAPAHPRYATPIHFWVHALRDELSATGRRVDLVGAAGHALCRKEPVEGWVSALRAGAEGAVIEEIAYAVESAPRAEAYRMLESECRRSSVVDGDGFLVADFWSHGAGASWRVHG